MREIKFRAWDGEKMVWFGDIGFFEGRAKMYWKENSVVEWSETIMQYTGLKDKNGKEIYEGDVVKWYINGLERIAPVYYDEQAACFWMANDSETNSLILNDWMRGEYGIIGNIYEHPHLLNSEPEDKRSVATKVK